MKGTPLFAALLLLGSPAALALTEGELRQQNSEQAAKIKVLEHEIQKLKGGKIESKQEIQTSDSKASSSENTYIVRKGDNIDKIARRLDCSVQALVSSNGLKRSSIIHPGQKLRVPVSLPNVAKAEKPAVAHESRISYQTHTIKQGETYGILAKKYGTSVQRLISANPKAKATALRPGMKVRIPVKVSAPVDTPKPVGQPAMAKQESKQPAPKPAAAKQSEKPQSPAPATAKAEPAKAGATVGISAPAAQVPVSTAPVAAQAPLQAPQSSVAKAETPAAPAKSSDAPGKIRPVTVEGEVSFGDFASQHGTDIARLNNLNGLDLTSTTVLAKGSELYVPAQP